MGKRKNLKASLGVCLPAIRQLNNFSFEQQLYFGSTGGSIGSHAAKHRRPLLTPDEVMRIGEDEAIARTSNKYPMRLDKGYYDAPPKTYPITPSLAEVYVEETAVAEDLAL